MTPSITPMTILFLALVPAACKTFSEFRSSSKEDIGRGFAIVPKTIVPPEMLVNATRIQKNSPSPTIIEPIQVAPGLLLLSEIIRPRAYLRQGPGTHYEVGDQILAKGSRVIVQAQVGIWRKVQVMADGRVGWLHSKSVSDPVLNKSFIRVESKSLPTVSTIRPVGMAESFPERERIAVSIPKGTVFSSLRMSQEGILVLLPPTQSVLWLSKKDAK